MTHTLWQIALGIGAVVLLVVVALLTLLLAIVRDIARGSEAVAANGGRIAANTAALDELPTTARVLRDVRAEAIVHHELLRRAVGE